MKKLINRTNHFYSKYFDVNDQITYKRPVDVSFTDMAIYIDNNMWNDYKNEEIFCRYIYHLCYMLACKRRYFVNIEDYDDFALYCTSRLYNRFTDKEKSKLKSSLNFIKNTLFFLKVDYQRLMFPVNYEYEFEKRKFNTDLYKQTCCDNLRHNYYLEDLDFFVDNFKLIFQIVKNIINESPFSKDKTMKHNLYMSVLLTLLNQLTLPKNFEESKINVIDFLTNERKDGKIILWNVPDKLKDYVKFICNKSRALLTHENKELKNYWDLKDEDINDILNLSNEKEGIIDELE